MIPQYSQAATASWVAVILVQQIATAFSIPNATGRLCSPSARSPSMLLKSLTMAIPSPAMLYSIVRITSADVNSPKSACPASHGSVM